MKKNRADVTGDEAGIDSESWSRGVVSRALKAAGWHWQRCIHLEAASQWLDKGCDLEGTWEKDLEPHLKVGSFILEGLLNPTYKRGTKTYRNNFVGVGNHSLAVKDGKVYDSAFAPGVAMGLSVLHLNGSRADPSIGFLRWIRRVYRCFKCTGKGGCKGAGGKCV